MTCVLCLPFDLLLSESQSVRATELKDLKTNIKLSLFGRGLDKKDFFGTHTESFLFPALFCCMLGLTPFHFGRPR
jgi:hypothetical protein